MKKDIILLIIKLVGCVIILGCLVSCYLVSASKLISKGKVLELIISTAVGLAIGAGIVFLDKLSNKKRNNK